MKDVIEGDAPADADARAAEQKVRRRRVYFISGYDPNGPRRYYQLYRAEAVKQAEISGYEMEVGSITYEPGAHVAGWTAALTDGDRRTEAEIYMLRWDDIARDWMRMSGPKIYALMAKTWWRYVGSGAFWALTGLRNISTWVGMYPVAMLIIYLLASLGLGWAAMRVTAALTGLPLWWMIPLGVIVYLGAMRLARSLDEHVMVYYLMCDFGFTAAHAEGEAQEIEDRLDMFAERVFDDWRRNDCDEVLIVGHSSGGSYAASVAARIIAMGADKRKGPHVSFLTLGQTIPMLSFLPGAELHRDELRTLGRAEEVDWIDVSSPADGACYALSDPVGVSGVAPPMAERRNPKVISATFWEAISPEMKAEMKGRWFRKHIQYLCAFDRPKDFDYFRVTAGPLLLADRFAARNESPKLKGAPFIQQRLRDI